MQGGLVTVEKRWRARYSSTALSGHPRAVDRSASLLAEHWLWAGVDGLSCSTQDANGPSNPALKVRGDISRMDEPFYSSLLLPIILLLGMILC